MLLVHAGGRAAEPPMRSFMRMVRTKLFAACLVAAACASRSATVEWQGHALQEVTTLSDLPVAIRTALGASRQGVEGIADRSEPFNETDVIDSALPMRRFLTAGANGRIWLVAVERGGRGYNVEVLLFSEQATPKRRWVLLDHPRSLRDVVQQVSEQEDHEG